MIKLIDILLENEFVEIKNIDYYKQILDKSNGLSIDNRKFFNSLINSIKKQNNKATQKQFKMLQRLKSGDFKYHSKN
jgi:hypothetical protein